MGNLIRRPTLLNEMNRILGGRWPDDGDLSSAATSTWAPAVDIKEEEKQFLIYADIPGVDPEKINIHMEDGVLTIHGEKNSESKIEEENYSRVERFSGSFYRRFSLPDTADADGITAESKNGVLLISIPKSAKSQPRKIEVKNN